MQSSGYMDSPAKQWVYDWMASWKAAAEDKSNPYGPHVLLLLLVLPFFFNVIAGVAWLVVVFLIFIFGAPSGNSAVRCSGENAKNITPVEWAKIYDNVVKELAEEERLVSALRRSGMGGWHWW